MRKLLALIAVFGMLSFGASTLKAQEDETMSMETTVETTTDTSALTGDTALEEAAIDDPTILEDESQIQSTSFHAALKQKFIEGGAFWMLPIALCLIFGLLAHLIGLLFSYVFNLECGTHVDPPAVAIGSLSLVIFTLF